MNERRSAGLTILSGRFGSGKTETALNYAVLLAQGCGQEGGDRERDVRSCRLEFCPSTSTIQQPTSDVPPPVLIDLDVVTPYFRSRDVTDALWERGVEVISPSLIGHHLDTPAITPQILGAIQQFVRPVVLDVGGDLQGARALGQYRSAILQRSYVVHFVVNPYRPFTDTLPGLTRSIAEIEASSRLRVSSLVSNPNLIGETTTATIIEGHARVETYARELGLPIACVCVEQRLSAQFTAGDAGLQPFAQPVLPLKRNFVMAWE